MKKELTVFEKHQMKIAKATLKMSDVGARVMGGMTKDEAREFLKKHNIRRERQCIREKQKTSLRFKAM